MKLNIISVRIVDMTDDVVHNYVAESIDDCNDDVDKEVFNLVMEHKDQIMMGRVLGIPNWGL